MKYLTVFPILLCVTLASTKVSEHEQQHNKDGESHLYASLDKGEFKLKKVQKGAQGGAKYYAESSVYAGGTDPKYAESFAERVLDKEVAKQLKHDHKVESHDQGQLPAIAAQGDRLENVPIIEDVTDKQTS